VRAILRRFHVDHNCDDRSFEVPPMSDETKILSREETLNTMDRLLNIHPANQASAWTRLDEHDAEQRARIAELTAERDAAVEAGKADRARLDWLESKWVDYESCPLTECEGEWHADGMPNGPMVEDMCAAIDAAMLADQEPAR
jgi:hypothetical protein